MVEKIGGWVQDVLTRIYNVQLEEEGLAVEFGDKDRGPSVPVSSRAQVK